ncbi:reverse transcriptase domain-containing protein [Tanacetum coccineum]
MVQWTTEADEAFRRMKELLEALPTVTAPINGETLIMYLAASEESISTVLMAERGKRQVIVYFISRTIEGAELEYPELEKLILALVYATRRLRRYFQAHPIQIEFRRRNSIKGQILADFLAKTPSKEEEELKDEEAKRKESELESAWKLFTDGASSSDGSGAEYEALLAGLRIAKEMKVQELTIFVDSQLVTNQVKGLFEVEVTNREIVKGMERWLGKTYQGWVNKLPQVLWAHRTTPKSSNRETPFSLVYGSETVIPIEISIETRRIQDFDPKKNEKRRREDLDILKERREIALIKEAHYKQNMEIL